MGKRGFTLVELIAVIALLAIVVVIAVPSINGVTNSIKQNMLDKKIAMIEEAAVLYGQDSKGSIISSTNKYDSTYTCKSIIVSTLVPNYLDKDNDSECLTDENNSGGCIVDPSNKDNYLDKKEVIIYYKNKRIYAKVDIDDTLSCS